VVDAQRTTIGELSFEVIPDLFVGIEFRRVGWEAFEVKSRMTSEQRGQCWAAMNGAAVPQQHDVAAELTQQQPQEGSDFEVAEGVEMEVTVEPESLALGAHRHGGDGRDAVVAVAVDEPRRLGAGRLGPAHGRGQQEAAFVQKSQIGSQPARFFLIAVQR
jgi:hypothetical protein